MDDLARVLVVGVCALDRCLGNACSLCLWSTQFAYANCPLVLRKRAFLSQKNHIVSADGAPTRHNIYCPTTHHQKEDDMKGCQKIIFSVDADAMSAANLDEQNYLRIIPCNQIYVCDYFDGFCRRNCYLSIPKSSKMYPPSTFPPSIDAPTHAVPICASGGGGKPDKPRA